jgi:SAM-dependent methyltransferase
MNSLLNAAEELEAGAARERVAYLDSLGPLVSPILDVGCGNAYSVAELRLSGRAAIGLDSSFYRMSRWLAEGLRGRPLVLASAAALPFRDRSFSAVISSGMLEHIGVHEQSSPYRVEGLPSKHQSRAQALAELSRVCRGRMVLDFPNGSFPIDFWHGDTLGSFRVHLVPDVLNPTLRELRSYVPGLRLRVEPLGTRLRFRQVSRRSWGRLLAPFIRTYLRFLDCLPRELPLLSLLYPFLVVTAEPVASNPSRGARLPR